MQLRLTLGRASRFRWYACLLLCSVAANAFAQEKPLPTQYVECVRDDNGVEVASRSIPTPVFDSKQGFKAYGVVVASRSPEGACTNTTTIYFTKPEGVVQVALQQQPERLPDGSVYDGNGIENIQWSPAGTRLLIEVSQWTWGTDSTWNRKYILVTPGTGEVRELPIMTAIQKHFAKPCAWGDSSKGWSDETRIEIGIEAAKDVDEEGLPDPTPSCVGNTTHFSYDVNSGDFLKW